MKYTNYIINGSVIDVEKMLPEGPIAKNIVIFGLIPVSIAGLAVLGGMIPFTLGIDGYRSLKMRYYIYMKGYRRFKYYKKAFSTLTISLESQKKILTILTNGRKTLLDSSVVSIPGSKIPAKTKIGYALIKSSYFITDRQLEAQELIVKGLDKSFGAISKTLSHLEPK